MAQHEAHGEDVAILPKGCFAIIIHPDGAVEMAIPKLEGVMPQPFLAATMVGLKFMREPKWVQELVDEFVDAAEENRRKRQN